MRKFSWYTSNKKYSGNGCYVTTKVHHALTDFAYNECVEHYRPNMKGGHRHNHIYNVCNRITFRGKKSRRVRPDDKKYFVSIFWENIALMPNELNKILANKRRRK